MARLFISQERLDEWTADEKASLVDNRLTLTELGRSFSVQPAVRFLSVAGNEEDPNDLLDCVKTEEELEAIGADLYMNSVIHGDVAYDVQAGFVGQPEPKSGA
jgi:hypothetical protein